MNAIVLPAGTTHVHFEELAYLIADAMYPDAGPDDGRLRAGYALANIDEELDMDARAGKLLLRNELTLGPHQVPRGEKIVNALVTVEDLRDYVGRNRKLIVTVKPSKAPPKGDETSAGNDDKWKLMAQVRAVEIIERQRKRDLYPAQIEIADEIAAEFRKNGIVGAGGKPLKGSYIKRHALAGISSEKTKQVSTGTHRGK